MLLPPHPGAHTSCLAECRREMAVLRKAALASNRCHGFPRTFEELTGSLHPQVDQEVMRRVAGGLTKRSSELRLAKPPQLCQLIKAEA